MNFNQLFQKMRELDQPVAEEKQADKDYDGDGEVESGKDEYMGSRDKAIKQAMSNDDEVDEGEGSENMSIGQKMARDGITYSPEKEKELIGLMSQYMKKEGMSSREIRYYLSYDEDYISDQLSDLPKEGGDDFDDSDNPKNWGGDHNDQAAYDDRHNKEEVDEGQLGEIGDTEAGQAKLNSYVNTAVDDAVRRSNTTGYQKGARTASELQGGPSVGDNNKFEKDPKIDQRQRGIGKAITRMSGGAGGSGFGGVRPGQSPSLDNPIQNEVTDVDECGLPGMNNMPSGMMGMSNKQQDSVSMNLSMNGSGSGGIRDLMSILKNIESGDHSHGNLELPGMGDMDSNHKPSIMISKNPILGDEFANSPDPIVSQGNFPTDTGNDLHKPKNSYSDKPYRGDNPMAVEGIKNRLDSLYQEVKSR